MLTKASVQNLSKTAIVRELLREDPKAPVARIVSDLKRLRNGDGCDPSMVYSERRRMQDAGEFDPVANFCATDTAPKSDLEQYMEVRDLIDRIGSVARVKHLVELYEKYEK